MKSLYIALLLAVVAILPLRAQEKQYIFVAQPTEVFENAKVSYPMVNQFEEPLQLLPGMLFELKGETDKYAIVDLPGWTNVHVPKSALGTPVPYKFAGGTLQMVYEPDSYPVVFTPATNAEGVQGWNVTFNGDTLWAYPDPRGFVIIDDPYEPGHVYGGIVQIGGRPRVWIYNTTYVLPWN